MGRIGRWGSVVDGDGSCCFVVLFWVRIGEKCCVRWIGVGNLESGVEDFRSSSKVCSGLCVFVFVGR